MAEQIFKLGVRFSFNKNLEIYCFCLFYHGKICFLSAFATWIFCIYLIPPKFSLKSLGHMIVCAIIFTWVKVFQFFLHSYTKYAIYISLSLLFTLFLYFSLKFGLKPVFHLNIGILVNIWSRTHLITRPNLWYYVYLFIFL